MILRYNEYLALGILKTKSLDVASFDAFQNYGTDSNDEEIFNA